MATLQPVATMAARPAGLAGQLRSRVQRLLATLAEHRRIARERHHLAALDERQLRDIGLTHRQAERESRRNFWE
jgi:uncharacterized protein YjiS (DUF1127 family)